jgi:N-acetylmuramoyl-L-alanine amidase
MKISRSLPALLGWLAVLTGARADWELFRFEGRDYVALGAIAAFYGLPAPPPVLDATDPKSTVVDLQFTLPPFPLIPLVIPGKKLALKSDKAQLEVELQTRVATINGMTQWLAHPVIVQDGRVLVSRIDLTKVIEPRLRPERIAGLLPVETVVLDPGHGGHDRGAISRLGFEKDFALDVAKRARTLLEKEGYKVVLTRSTDVFMPLHDRAAIANSTSNSVLVSIHFNQTGTNPNARGFEIYTMAPRGVAATNDTRFSVADLREEPGNSVELPSAALAGSIYASLLGQVPNVDRGMKHARFAVLRLSSIPSTLIECGFLSNSGDNSLINTAAWRAQIAEAIVDGIDGYKLLAEKGRAPKTVAEYRR